MVRAELIKAREDGLASGAAGNLTFEVGKVSVEFTGEVTKTGGAGGGVKFWVLNVDAKGERASGTAQKVTVELVPQSPDGRGFQVAGDLDTLPQR